MAKSKLFMQYTEVPAEKSAAAITSLLIQAGAEQIAADYKDGKIVGLRFTLPVAGQVFAFDLPARTEPVFKILWKGNTGRKTAQQVRADAERIGWRQLLRWVEAQLAMIDAGMVSAHEVFYPYLLEAGGSRTMFQVFEQEALKPLKLLPAPGVQ